MNSGLLLRLLLIIVAATPLYACAPGASAIAESLRLLKPGALDRHEATLVPGVRYLRVLFDGGVTLMALGYVEPGPEGDTEVWYSAEGEVLRIRHGRIVGSAGLATDWRDVRLPRLPRWSTLAHGPVRYERSRDEMPGYRMNIKEAVQVRAIEPPARNALIGYVPNQLAWYEESIAGAGKDKPVLPPSRFAVKTKADVETVAYGEQCLAENMCLTWQLWPVAAGTGE